MERDEREDIYMIEARKIAETINSRDATLTSSFKLWLKDGDYFATQIDSHVPDAKLLYTGQGWESGDESKVDEEWVMENIEIPEDE